MKYALKIPTMTIKLTSNTFFTLLIGVMLCHYTLFDYFAVIIGKLPVMSIFKPLFFPILYSLLALLSLNSARLKWIRANDIGIIIFLTVSILLTIIFHPQNSQYIAEELWTDILPCIPFFMLGLCIDLDEDTYKTISLLSCLAILVSTLYVRYFLNSGRTLGGSHNEDYSMYWSYLLLPNTLIAIDYFFKSKKLLPAICSATGVIYAFAMGTRGSIVVLAVFIIICVWRYINLRTSKKIIVMGVLGIFVWTFISSSLYTQALLEFRDFLDNNGVSTRVIDYLISGEMVSQTTGRDDIYIDLLNKLNEHPFLGYGVYGEYPLGYHAGAHNIYLQVVFHFGYPLGSIIMLSYITVFIKALIKTKGNLIQSWIALFGCLVFVRGIFGGNYLNYTVFFLLGLCLKSLREERYKQKTDKETGELSNGTKSVYNI